MTRKEANERAAAAARANEAWIQQRISTNVNEIEESADLRHNIAFLSRMRMFA